MNKCKLDIGDRFCSYVMTQNHGDIQFLEVMDPNATYVNDRALKIKWFDADGTLSHNSGGVATSHIRYQDIEDIDENVFIVHGIIKCIRVKTPNEELMLKIKLSERT